MKYYKNTVITDMIWRRRKDGIMFDCYGICEDVGWFSSVVRNCNIEDACFIEITKDEARKMFPKAFKK